MPLRYLVLFYLTILNLSLVSIECSLASENTPLFESQILKLVRSENRYKNDSLRDADRRPSKILKFSEIASSDVVLDLYAGGGWYTELFSMAVGPAGKVYAHNDYLTWRFGGKEIIERTKGGRLSNVIRLDKVELSKIAVPDSSVDVAFMGINYHDLFFTHRVRDGRVEKMREEVVDHAKALANIRRKLKDDGILIITDHFAKPGSGYQAANDLHRIDPNIVKFHLQEAGFVLLEEAYYLHNPDDNLNLLVFDPEIRGKTSRFIYKFGKRNTKGN